MKIIQVLSKFRKIFNTSIYLRYHIAYQEVRNVSFLENFACVLNGWPHTTTEEVKKLLKDVNAKKASGFDKIATKLVKLGAGVLAPPLSKTINNSISKGVFPYEANMALVSPLDKKTPDKNCFKL